MIDSSRVWSLSTGHVLELVLYSHSRQKMFPKLSKYPVFKRFFLTFFGTTRGKERMWNGFEKFVLVGSVSRWLATNFIILSLWTIVWWSQSSNLNERSLFVDNVSQHFFRYAHCFVVAKSVAFALTIVRKYILDETRVCIIFHFTFSLVTTFYEEFKFK